MKWTLVQFYIPNEYMRPNPILFNSGLCQSPLASWCLAWKPSSDMASILLQGCMKLFLPGWVFTYLSVKDFLMHVHSKCIWILWCSDVTVSATSGIVIREIKMKFSIKYPTSHVYIKCNANFACDAFHRMPILHFDPVFNTTTGVRCRNIQKLPICLPV